jgi:hypothetical protein
MIQIAISPIIKLLKKKKSFYFGIPWVKLYYWMLLESQAGNSSMGLHITVTSELLGRTYTLKSHSSMVLKVFIKPATIPNYNCY